MELNIIVGISNLSLAVLLIVLSIPLIQRKVKMNHLYGVRIKKAFESEENWYKINAYGGRLLMIWGAVLAVLSVATFVLPLGSMEHPNTPMIAIASLVPVIVIIPCVVQILLYARKL